MALGVGRREGGEFSISWTCYYQSAETARPLLLRRRANVKTAFGNDASSPKFR